MACCGLCRPKVKPTIKTNKNITTKKINTIDTWIENIEGPNEPIILPVQPPDKPEIITNKEEITEAEKKHHLSDISMSIKQDKNSQYDNFVFNRNIKNRKQNFQYLASGLSINGDIQSAMSGNDSINNL